MTSFADILRPSNKLLAASYDVFCVVAGSLFIALMAQLSFPLWVTPVPFTMQTFAVLLVGALLGSKRGALAVIAYLIEGALGFPVFSGGAFGLFKLLGPSGGYFFGFILCAFSAGLLLENNWRRSFITTFLALSIGAMSVWAFGGIWLSFFVGPNKAFLMGVVPFMLGDMTKAFISALLIRAGWSFLK